MIFYEHGNSSNFLCAQIFALLVPCEAFICRSYSFQVLTLLHYVWSSHSREVPKEILICLVWWLRKVLRKIISRESLEKLVGKIVKS